MRPSKRLFIPFTHFATLLARRSPSAPPTGYFDAGRRKKLSNRSVLKHAWAAQHVHNTRLPTLGYQPSPEVSHSSRSRLALSWAFATSLRT